MKTSKQLIVTAILLLFAGSMAAQQRFDASLFAGANFNQIDGDGAGSYNKLGFRSGVGTSFTLGHDTRSPWRMVVEVAFAQKGSRVDPDGLNRSIRLDYVELPLMLSYTALEGRLRIAAGVAPAVLTSARVTDNEVRNNAQEDNFRRFDWLPLTASLRYRFGERLAVEARYQNSMLSISEQNSTGTYRIVRENKGAFSRNITLGLVYELSR